MCVNSGIRVAHRQVNHANYSLIRSKVGQDDLILALEAFNLIRSH